MDLFESALACQPGCISQPCSSMGAARPTGEQRWLDLGVELDNLVFGQRPGVVSGFHLCRGNQRSRWQVEGGYDWLAQRLFPRVGAQRLLRTDRCHRRARLGMTA